MRSVNWPSAWPSISGTPETSHSLAAPRVTLRKGRSIILRARTVRGGGAGLVAGARPAAQVVTGLPSGHWAWTADQGATPKATSSNARPARELLRLLMLSTNLASITTACQARSEQEHGSTEARSSF